MDEDDEFTFRRSAHEIGYTSGAEKYDTALNDDQIKALLQMPKQAQRDFYDSLPNDDARVEMVYSIKESLSQEYGDLTFRFHKFGDMPLEKEYEAFIIIAKAENRIELSKQEKENFRAFIEQDENKLKEVLNNNFDCYTAEERESKAKEAKEAIGVVIDKKIKKIRQEKLDEQIDNLIGSNSLPSLPSLDTVRTRGNSIKQMKNLTRKKVEVDPLSSASKLSREEKIENNISSNDNNTKNSDKRDSIASTVSISSRSSSNLNSKNNSSDSNSSVENITQRRPIVDFLKNRPVVKFFRSTFSRGRNVDGGLGRS